MLALVGLTVTMLVALVLASALWARTGPRPVISGEASVGQTLSSSDAGDSGLYRWQRCNPSSSTCTDAEHHADPNWPDIEGANQQSYTLAAADAGTFIRVIAKGTSLGEQWVPSEPIGPVAVDPAPDLHRTAVVDSVGPGDCSAIALTGGRRIEVDELTEVPLGTVVNTDSCAAQVITAINAQNDIQSAKFWCGRFKLRQGRGSHPRTILKLVGPLVPTGARACSKAGSGLAQAGSALAQTAGLRRKCRRKSYRRRHRKRCRRVLWGSGSGSYTTGGSYGSGTVRGTVWKTTDGFGYTCTFVKSGGPVIVRDFVKKKFVKVKAGKRYCAKKKRRRGRRR